MCTACAQQGREKIHAVSMLSNFFPAVGVTREGDWAGAEWSGTEKKASREVDGRDGFIAKAATDALSADVSRLREGRAVRLLRARATCQWRKRSLDRSVGVLLVVVA